MNAGRFANEHFRTASDVGHANSQPQSQTNRTALGAEQQPLSPQTTNRSSVVTGAASHLVRATAAAALSKGSALATVSEPPIENASVGSVADHTLAEPPCPLVDSLPRTTRPRATSRWLRSIGGKRASSTSPTATAPSSSCLEGRRGRRHADR